jgi:hypothetical protein
MRNRVSVRVIKYARRLGESSMGQTAWVPLWRGIRGSGRFGLASFVLLGSALTAIPATAQTGGQGLAGQAPLRVCGAAWAPEADPSDSDRNAPRTVQALCWGTWLVLGSADSFRVSVNFDLEATVVELTRDGEPSVLLIRPDGRGQPFIENMDSTLAEVAGRTSFGDLKGLAVDFDEFAFTGRVGLVRGAQAAARETGDRSSAAESAAATRVGVAAVGTFGIGDHIARDRARLARAGAQ